MKNKISSKLSALLGLFVALILAAWPLLSTAGTITSSVVNTFVVNGQTIKASSNATPVLGLNLASSTAHTLTAVRVTVAGQAGFDPAVDLAALTNATSSGVALWSDGSGATDDGSFNAAG